LLLLIHFKFVTWSIFYLIAHGLDSLILGGVFKLEHLFIILASHIFVKYFILISLFLLQYYHNFANQAHISCFF